jgi:REP element-mobilizing transposase RayT
MARPLRIERPGAWYHVTARGNERRPIYLDDGDRRRFCEVLGETVERFRWALHAYVLMDNHFHLLLETPEANLSRAMQWLNVSYSVWFNRRHGRAGHLFQGRYQAIVVDPKGWGLELSRYVHLNPVRVGKWGRHKAARQGSPEGVVGAPKAEEVRERIARLRGYRWSSYRAYMGLDKGPAWLRCDEVLGWVGGRPGKRQREAYREHVESAVRQGLAQSPWEGVSEQVVLGGAQFVRKMVEGLRGDAREQTGLRRLQGRPKLAEVITVVEKLKGEKWEEFRDRYGDWGRDLVLYLGRKACGLKLKELGVAAGGIDYVSVSAAVRRFEMRLGKDAALARALSRARQALQT